METGVAIIFSLAGLILIFLGIWSIRNACLEIRTWKTVSGTIVGYKVYNNQQANGSSTSFCPQVQFSTDDGKVIDFTSSGGSNRRPYRIGAAIKVLHDPINPAKATIKSVSNLFLPAFFLLLFGVAFAGMFLSILFFGPHRIKL
jgi:uncharacterized protein DUF3592